MQQLIEPTPQDGRTREEPPQPDLVEVLIPPAEQPPSFEPEVIPDSLPEEPAVQLEISQPRNLTNNEPLEAEVVEEEEEPNEFELINEDDYDFQLKKHQEQLQKIQLEEFKTEADTYYLPKVDSRTRALSDDKASKIDIERLNDANDHFVALEELHENLEMLKESLRKKEMEVIVMKASDSYYSKAGNPIYDVVEQESLEGSSSSSISQKIKEDYSIVQPEKDQNLVGFYNNGEFRGGPDGEDNSIQNLIINTKFKIDSKLQKQVSLAKNYQEAFLLGRRYDAHLDFQKDFSKLLWLTYRKNFSPLLIEKNKVANLTCDSGWGCVIRCTQMLVAAALQRYLMANKELIPLRNFESSDLSKSVLIHERASINVQILDLFDDDKRNEANNPFSIQNVVEVGLQEHGRLPGEWYGVAKMNEIFESLSKAAPEQNSSLPNDFLAGFKICAFEEGEVVIKEVLKAGMGAQNYDAIVEGKPTAAATGSTGEASIEQKPQLKASTMALPETEAEEFKEVLQDSKFIKDTLAIQKESDFDFETARPTVTDPPLKTSLGSGGLDEEKVQEHFQNAVLILVSIRLGLDRIPKEFFPTISECFKLKQFVGAVGGRPNFAHYFTGSTISSLTNKIQGLIYLDPHFVQEKVSDLAKEYLEIPAKFHYSQARVIDLANLDPTLSFGYLVRSYDEYLDLVESITQINENLPEEFRVITIQNEGIEERVINQMRASAIKKQQEGCSKSILLQSVVSIQSDYIK